MHDESSDTVSFGSFRLSPAARRLERDGVPVVLGDRALDILVVLIERAGEVVSHRELLAGAWRNRVVGQGSLRVHISALRKALGDGEDGARYIENVTGQGYCFVAPATRDQAPRALMSRQEFPGVAQKRLTLPPKLARMVGRDDVVRALADDLMTERFITIIGPGGMGKTTVAIAVAHAMTETFGGAVCFVDIGAVADPGLVAITIASSLGLAVQTDALPTLLDYLQSLRILLVLDNCEHVIDVVAALAETIHRQTTGVYVLATSREAMRVEGEHAYWLPPLATPTPVSSLKADDVRKFPSIELFLERAAAGGGRFDLDDDTAPIVAGICGRLDGMALAIELAAGRAGSYGISATAELLNRNLGLDWHGRRTALPRHQTLRALLDWSYGLLDALNQRALRHLSVLVGDFDARAAGAVMFDGTPDEAATAEVLHALVSKSLISVRPGAEAAHYRVLETTRIYAREKLADSGEARATQRRHAQYVAGLLNACHGGHIDLEYTGRAHVLREHLGNVRAALDWCFVQDQGADRALAVDLAAAAAPVFFELSLLSEANRWSEAGVAALDDATRGSRRELILRSTFAISSMWTRGSDGVLAEIARCMELAPLKDEPAQRLRLQATRHMVLTRGADFRGSLDASAEWDQAARQVNDVQCLAITELFYAQARHYLGDQRAAMRHFEAGFALAGTRTLQLCGMDQRMRGLVAWSRVLWLTGFPDRALAASRESVECGVRTGKPLNVCFALLFSCPVHVWRRDWERAQDGLDQLVAHSHWSVLEPFHTIAVAMQGATLIGRGDVARGTSMLLGLRGKMREECLNFLGTSLASVMAIGLTKLGRAMEAVEVIRRARRWAVRGGDAAQLPELLRVQAQALLSVSPGNETRVIRLLERACRVARQQGAPSWELRSAMDLARIHMHRGELDQALKLLAPIYGGFSEGFDTPDLVDARSLMLGLERAALPAPVDEAEEFEAESSRLASVASPHLRSGER